MSIQHPTRSEPVPYVHHIRVALFPCMVKRLLTLAGIHRSTVEREAFRLLLRGCFPNPRERNRTLKRDLAALELDQ